MEQGLGASADADRGSREPSPKGLGPDGLRSTSGIKCEPMPAVTEDGWCEWTHPLPGYLMQCCDCDLIHEVEFAIVPCDEDLNTGDLNDGEGENVIIFRMRRHTEHPLATMTRLDEELGLHEDEPPPVDRSPEGGDCPQAPSETRAAVPKGQAPTPTPTLVNQGEAEILRGALETLWDIIDDIDTADDIAKSDDKLYRELVTRLQAKRWDTGITTDGQTLNLAAKQRGANTSPAEAGILRAHIADQIKHVENRIQDGKEMGATVWRIALEDIVRENTAVLASLHLTAQGGEG